MTSVLLVDDHRTFLAGTALILEKHGFHTTASSSGEEAVALLERSAFDLCIFDLKLPGMNGFDLTEAALRLRPDATIVILTGEDVADHYDRLIEIGAACLLEKSLGEQEFIGSLRLAMQKLVVLPLHLARRLRTQDRFAAGREEGGASRIQPPPSDKETAVLKMIAHGHTNKEIAERLFMSQRNVEYAISHLFGKLGAASRQEAVVKAIERKWLSLND